ncbi:hypothetical protein TGGT1_291130 [Toxoplasma gondii GT1]|uniref:Glutamic acid-rich protein n=2 Tax=Toxoplasma gondii TaxID=5811 RepID=S7VY07_TOXGG|nr:hypothetical protein TGGT1_291130 [Toxoplasma gondii GT1]KAF4644553.1 hypothetical protein TGRH88_015470 [Toxoplasma gondii]
MERKQEGMSQIENAFYGCSATAHFENEKDLDRQLQDNDVDECAQGMGRRHVGETLQNVGETWENTGRGLQSEKEADEAEGNVVKQTLLSRDPSTEAEDDRMKAAREGWERENQGKEEPSEHRQSVSNIESGGDQQRSPHEELETRQLDPLTDYQEATPADNEEQPRERDCDDREEHSVHPSDDEVQQQSHQPEQVESEEEAEEDQKDAASGVTGFLLKQDSGEYYARSNDVDGDETETNSGCHGWSNSVRRCSPGAAKEATPSRTAPSSKAGLYLRFRTIASIVDCLPSLQDPSARRYEATTVAAEILESLEQRAENLLVYNTRIVSQMKKRVESGRTSSGQKGRLRFDSLPDAIEEDEHTMYGQWKLREETAAEAASGLLRALGESALEKIASQDVYRTEGNGQHRTPYAPEYGEDPTQEEHSPCMENPSSRLCSGESNQTVDSELEETNLQEEMHEDISAMSDEKAAKEFDLWLGRTTKIPKDCPPMKREGEPEVSSVLEKALGHSVSRMFPQKEDLSMNHDLGTSWGGKTADVTSAAIDTLDTSAKAAAARQLVTPSLKQEKLWQLFGRDTEAGRLLHQLYASRAAALGAFGIVYPVPKMNKDSKSNPNFLIRDSKSPSIISSRRGHPRRVKVSVPRVGRHPVPQTDGDLHGHAGCGCCSVADSGRPSDYVGGKRSLAKISKGMEQQRKEILAEAQAAAERAATYSRHGQIRERAKEALQEAFYFEECRTLPAAARLPALPRQARQHLLQTSRAGGQEKKGLAGTPFTAKVATGGSTAARRAREWGKQQTDPEEAMNREQKLLFDQTLHEIRYREERLRKLRDELPDDVLTAAACPESRGVAARQKGAFQAVQVRAIQMGRYERVKRKVQENLREESKLVKEIAERVRDLQTLSRLSGEQLHQKTGALDRAPPEA